MKKLRWLRKKVHYARHIGLLSLGVLVGVALAAIHKGDSSTALIVVSAACLVISCIRPTRYMLLFALASGIIFGLWRGSVELKGLEAYTPFYNKQVNVHGLVAEDTSYGSKGDQRIRLRNVQIGNQQLPGVIWVSSNETATIKRGDVLDLAGRLTPGFGNAPATMYQAKVGSIGRPYPGDVARRFRDWFADSIRRAIPEPAGSLSVGYLVGQKTALSETLINQLKIVGLTHVVVASGYNLTILVGVTRRLFARFSKYLAALTAVSLILGFILITGFSPSMTRAGLVSLLGLATWYYGRSMHPVILLLFSAAVTAVWRPAYVWGDIGWYLSFVAFTGVIVLAPLLKRYFFGAKKLGVLQQTLIDTTAAQLLTMPIILHAFGQYATYALLANILVLPLVPLAMLLTFFAGIGGLVLPAFAELFGWPARALLLTNLAAIGWVAKLPGASGEVNFGMWAVCISYTVLAGVVAYLWSATNYNFREPEAGTELF
jgi:competence protein ComEC